MFKKVKEKVERKLQNQTIINALQKDEERALHRYFSTSELLYMLFAKASSACSEKLNEIRRTEQV